MATQPPFQDFPVLGVFNLQHIREAAAEALENGGAEKVGEEAGGRGPENGWKLEAEDDTEGRDSRYCGSGTLGSCSLRRGNQRLKSRGLRVTRPVRFAANPPMRISATGRLVARA